MEGGGGGQIFQSEGAKYLNKQSGEFEARSDGWPDKCNEERRVG
jgi:hypothetical protein